MKPRYYVLKDREPALADLREWGYWYATADRHVGDDSIEGVRISTVFLGLDRNWADVGPPILFETMVFGLGEDLDMADRACTYTEAEEMHRKTVARVQAILSRRKQERAR